MKIINERLSSEANASCFEGDANSTFIPYLDNILLQDE